MSDFSPKLSRSLCFCSRGTYCCCCNGFEDTHRSVPPLNCFSRAFLGIRSVFLDTKLYRKGITEKLR